MSSIVIYLPRDSRDNADFPNDFDAIGRLIFVCRFVAYILAFFIGYDLLCRRHDRGFVFFGHMGQHLRNKLQSYVDAGIQARDDFKSVFRHGDNSPVCWHNHEDMIHGDWQARPNLQFGRAYISIDCSESPETSSSGEAGTLSPPQSGAPAICQGGEVASRLVHTQEIAGSSPAPATSFDSPDLLPTGDNAGARPTGIRRAPATEYQAKACDETHSGEGSEAVAERVSRLASGRTDAATSERMDVTAGETAP